MVKNATLTALYLMGTLSDRSVVENVVGSNESARNNVLATCKQLPFCRSSEEQFRMNDSETKFVNK